GQEPSRPAALIAPSLHFLIPDPGELGFPIMVAQEVRVHFKDSRLAFEADLAIADKTLHLVGLDPLGGRLLTLDLSEGRLKAETGPGFPAGLQPVNILADIAILYWPKAAVKRGLQGTSAEVRDEEGGRSVFFEGKEIIHASFKREQGSPWPESAHYAQFAFGYTLDIKSLTEGQ
ncbi:MAG TPA: DUF3261 domain-containing protein, partial [Stellaceae bacterium]|nr:DUF3261 domain-containing protein [Stellaceae bacterium]